jgi:hypothetical protein
VVKGIWVENIVFLHTKGEELFLPTYHLILILTESWSTRLAGTRNGPGMVGTGGRDTEIKNSLDNTASKFGSIISSMGCVLEASEMSKERFGESIKTSTVGGMQSRSPSSE